MCIYMNYAMFMLKVKRLNKEFYVQIYLKTRQITCFNEFLGTSIMQ